MKFIICGDVLIMEKMVRILNENVLDKFRCQMDSKDSMSVGFLHKRHYVVRMSGIGKMLRLLMIKMRMLYRFVKQNM